MGFSKRKKKDTQAFPAAGEAPPHAGIHRGSKHHGVSLAIVLPLSARVWWAASHEPLPCGPGDVSVAG
jgi:hypothetical protein